jgi:Ca-activated chloride channel family protein
MAGDYYAALGLSIDATPEEIRSAYFLAARRSHPDANPDARTVEWFLRVQEAYEVLANTRRRAEYDANLPDGLLAQPAVAVHLRTSRATIPRLPEPQLVYALVEINCTADPAQTATMPAHLCFVIDRSTSMQGDRMNMLKANLSQALHHLKPTDTVSVVSFSDRAEVVVAPTRVSAFSKVESHVYAIQTGGGTEIFQGLSLGVEQLRNSTGEEGLRQVILLTDGQTYGDEQSCLSLAEAASEEGIGFHALGIGHDWNDTFLDRLTGISGGSTVFIKSTKDLAGVLDQKMLMTSAVYARGISLEFREDANIALRYAFRLQPEVGSLLAESPLALGNLQRGKGISVLLEMVVAPLADEVDTLQLLDGRLKMQVFDRGARRARLFVDLRCPVKDDPEMETPPAAVLEAVARMTLYRMQEHARQQVEAGEPEKAARQLQFLATNLLSRGNRDFAHTVLAEAEHIRHSRVFTKDGDKRVKYGTRALLLPSGMEPRL